MRTDQLSPEGAWEMLKHLERVPRRRKLPGETELIEELSQLSKEYFFAHLDHDTVPETVASWARYGAAMPDRVPEPLEELVRRAGLLKKTLREDADTAEFMGMLRETVGMNERIRAERAWDPAGGEVRLPMVERYSHSLMSGRLLFTVPDHVKEGLVRSLSALDGYAGGSVRRMERLEFLASGSGTSRPVPAFGEKAVPDRIGTSAREGCFPGGFGRTSSGTHSGSAPVCGRRFFRQAWRSRPCRLA